MHQQVFQILLIGPHLCGGGGALCSLGCQLFFDAVFRLFGIPRSVLHDRDVCFTAVFWTSLLSILGTRVVLSSAYHPQTDG